MTSDGPGTRARRVGVVTGLASEAAIVTEMFEDIPDGVRVLCAGASAERAGQRARELVRDGVEALLSFGIAGAVAPDLDSGDLVIPDDVLIDDVDSDGNIRDICPCDRQWLERLQSALTEARLPYARGMLIGSRKLWCDAKEKEAVHEITEAVAIDMESGAVAAIAQDAGLPFLAVRAIADRAGDSLPALVATAVRPDGRAAVGRVLGALLRNPGDIPATMRLARRSELALARLRMLEVVKGALFGGF